MKILTNYKYNNNMTFEDAIIRIPLINYVNNKGWYIDNFQHSDRKFSGTLIKKYVDDNNIDVVLMPVSKDMNQNIHLPEDINCKVIYTINEDIENVSDFVSYIPNKFYRVSFDDKQFNFINRISKKNSIKLFPFVNEYVFYEDCDIEKNIDVIFIGKNSKERSNYVNYLAENGVVVNVYGSDWDGFEDIKNVNVFQRNNLTFQREIFNRAKIAFTMHDRIKFVHFELAACGCMLITKEKNKAINKYFNNINIDTFTDKEVMLKLINKHLKDNKGREAKVRKVKNYVNETYSSNNFFDKLFELV